MVSNEKFTELTNYLSGDFSYKEQLRTSYEDELYDFSVILIWKIFILYSYQAIRQYRVIIGEEEFNSVWKQGSLSEKKYDVSGYEIDNIYAYNRIDDDILLDLLGRMYPIDNNFIKRLKQLKNSRDVAAHIADEILLNTKEGVDHFFGEILKITGKVNEYHREKILSKVLEDKEVEMHLSIADTVYFVKNKIQKLSDALTFDVADSAMKYINRKKKFLSFELLESILANSVKNKNGAYNQVLEG